MDAVKNHSRTIFSILQFILLLAIILVAVFKAPQQFSSLFYPIDKVLVFNDSRSFDVFLKKRENTLAQVRTAKHIANLSALNLPEDLAHYPAGDRTSLFIRLVLTHAVKCNEKILLQRKKLIQYLLDANNGRFITKSRKIWLRNLAQQYKTPQVNPAKLLDRVDIIPVSMTIAQAITESGWGTSRFAQQGNAIYGQHLSKNSKGKFITSLYGGVKVAAFNSILDCTKNYIHNLNTSAAYKKLRGIRSQIRGQGKLPDGYSLASGLLNYSAIGEEYIADIRYLIRKYKLVQLEQTKLNKQIPVMVIRFTRDDVAADTTSLPLQGITITNNEYIF